MQCGTPVAIPEELRTKLEVYQQHL